MGEYSKYPNQIDTSTELPKSTDLVTSVNAAIVNRLRDAILSIENELGIQPSASFSTVKARLDNIDVLIVGLGQSLTVFDGQTSANLSGIQSDIASLQSLTASMQVLISIAQVDISALEAAMAIAQSDINTLEASMVTAQSDINALEAISINAGAGLTGGGTLTGNVTLTIAAADASIVVNPDSITVGVIADAQHGNRSGGSLHALAIAGGAAGFLSGTDKTKLDSMASGAGTYDVNPGDTAAEIEAAIAVAVAASRACRVAPGLYSLDAEIDIVSNAIFKCIDGIAVFDPQWVPVVGDADSVDNYVIGVRGVASGTTTTLTGNHLEASTTLVLASTAGLSAGSFLYLSGNNTPANDALTMSDGSSTFVREVVEVLTVDSGTGVTLTSPLNKHHSGGRTVTLLTSSPSDVVIEGISVASPGGTHAVGISVKYASNVVIKNCTFEGLSRACVDVLTSKNVQVHTVHSFGEVNSICLWDNSDDCLGDGITSSDTGLREHANGIPRGLWTIYGRCVRTTICNSNLQHANIGIRQWGGHYCGVEDCTVSDMISTAALARDPILATGFLANGFDSAPAPIADAQFSLGCWIRGLTVINCHSPVRRYEILAQPVWAVNLHDMLSFSVTGLSIQNRGSSTSTNMHGLHMQDCRGTINGLNIQGCWDAISTLGNYEDVDIFGCIINGAPSTSSPYLPLFAFYINGAAAGGAFRLHGAKITGYNNYFQVGAAAIAAPDLHLEWTDFQMGDICHAERVILARRIAATTPTEYPAGSVCELDPTQSTTTQRAVIDATVVGLTSAFGIVVGQEAYLTGHLFFAPLPQFIRGVRVDAATSMGAALSPNGRLLTPGTTSPVLSALTETSGAGTVMAGPPTSDPSSYDVYTNYTAAQISAAIVTTSSEGRACRAEPGTYLLDAPITITSSNVVFECPDGFATIVPRWSPNVSEADVRTNYVIGITSTLGGATTTLNATCKVGSRTLTLTNTSGFGAGDWIYLVGWNGVDDDTLMSAGAEVKAYELVQIASVDSGTVVTLSSRTKQHHANAKPAYRISSMVNNVYLSNIAIRADSYGDGYIGIGIAATRIQNLHIKNVEIECLTRAGIDMLACHDATVDNLYSYGEVNSWIAAEGCINYRLNELNGNPNGLRQHSSGVPRALVDQRGRCKWGSTTNAHFCHGNLAYREWGGAFLSLSDSSCEDMDATEAFARDSAMSAAGNTTTGLAWDSGAPDVLTWADFSIGSTVTNYRIDAASLRSPYVHTASPSWWMCIFLHDAFRVTFTNVNILNRGSAYEASPNTWVNGMDLRDCTGVLNNIHISGVYAAMSTRNVYARVTASNIYLEAVAGNGANSQWGYLMGAAGGVGAEVEFHHLEFSNFNGTEFEVGDEMALAAPLTDWDLNWHDVNFDGYVAEYVVLARNTTTAFTAGQIAQFDDSTSTDVGEAARMLKTPTAGAQDVCVVMKQDLSWCLVAPLPQIVTAGVDSAVTIGGLLAATTGRSLTPTSSQHLACARALRKTGNSKAAMISGAGLGSGDFLLKTPTTAQSGSPNLLSTFTTNQSKIAWRLDTTEQSSITDLSGAMTLQASGQIFLYSTGSGIRLVAGASSTLVESGTTIIMAPGGREFRIGNPSFLTPRATCWIPVDVTTTDATVTTAAALTLSATRPILVRASVRAWTADMVAVYTWDVTCAAKAGGSPGLVGSPIISSDGDAGLAACVVVVDVSAGTLRFRVTGIAATTISWSVTAWEEQ